MANMKTKGRGGSQPPNPATISKRSAPKSGKPVRTHPLNRGFPMSYRKPSAPVKATNPNAQTRQRLDRFSSIAHAHTNVTPPVKAYPINDRSKAAKRSKVAGDPKVMAQFRG
jgi:hypothetical protein